MTLILYDELKENNNIPILLAYLPSLCKEFRIQNKLSVTKKSSNIGLEECSEAINPNEQDVRKLLTIPISI